MKEEFVKKLEIILDSVEPFFQAADSLEKDGKSPIREKVYNMINGSLSSLLADSLVIIYESLRPRESSPRINASTHRERRIDSSDSEKEIDRKLNLKGKEPIIYIENEDNIRESSSLYGSQLKKKLEDMDRGG